MSRYFFITCLCAPIGDKGTRCTGFLRVDSNKIRTDADFVRMIQEHFDIAPINTQQKDFLTAYNNIGKNIKTPPAKPAYTTTEKYRPMTVQIFCMLDITNSPKGLFTVQFEAYGNLNGYRQCNVVMNIDFDDIENSGQLKRMVMEEYNLRTHSPYTLDVNRSCFITSMAHLSD